MTFLVDVGARMRACQQVSRLPRVLLPSVPCNGLITLIAVLHDHVKELRNTDAHAHATDRAALVPQKHSSRSNQPLTFKRCDHGPPPIHALTHLVSLREMRRASGEVNRILMILL